MSRPAFPFVPAIAAVAAIGSIAAFAACSTGGTAAPGAPDTSPTTLVDATVSPEAAPQPTCTMVDLTPGTGKKFCDLPGADAIDITVPPEFCVREFTNPQMPILEARVLKFAPNGDLFVAAPSQLTPGGASDGAGSIVILPDDDHDGRADTVLHYGGVHPRNGTSCGTLETDPKNLSCVHGLLFSGGYLYFTRSNEVRRHPYTMGSRTAPAEPGEVVATLGGVGIPDVRWTHTLEEHKSGAIYVSRGRFDSSGCSAEEMTRGAVFALHVETKAAFPLTPETLADGFRNPLYLKCAPNSCGDCYASELTGDGWDGVGGREKLALLENKAESWGYPCCVARDMPAPGAAASCKFVGYEQVAIPLHDTPFGFDFERGLWPEPYKHGVFSALHGITTSFGGTGIVFLKADPKSLRPTADVSMFVKGFGGGHGRATDVVFAPDGRMFIADDTLGRIYWVAPRTLQAPN